MLCAFCGDFLLNALGYQCEDCRYTCHKKCYEKVVTKCISKSNTGVSHHQFYLYSRSKMENNSRKVTRRRLTIVFPTASNPLRTLGQTGVAIVVICFLSGVKMHENAPSAILRATPIAPISFQISVACRWKQRMSYFATGVISTGLAATKRNPVRVQVLVSIPNILIQHLHHLTRKWEALLIV